MEAENFFTKYIYKSSSEVKISNLNRRFFNFLIDYLPITIVFQEVERGNPGDLAIWVNQMLASNSTFDKASKGRERVLSKYTYEHNASDYESIFNRAILKKDN